MVCITPLVIVSSLVLTSSFHLHRESRRDVHRTMQIHSQNTKRSKLPRLHYCARESTNIIGEMSKVILYIIDGENLHSQLHVASLA